MRYVPVSKKFATKRHRASKQLAVIERAVAAVRFAMPDAGICLPMCVLLKRLLARELPARHFFLRLGSLHVIPQDGTLGPVLFDPRGPDGIDGGFHAWLEDESGRLLDPSIHPTLGALGHRIDKCDCFIDGGRSFVVDGVAFLYEVLPELEVIGLPESEPHLSRLEAFALTAKRSPPGVIHLDVRWRTHEPAQRQHRDSEEEPRDDGASSRG